MHLSLVRGALPMVVGLLAAGTLAVAVVRRRPGWPAAVARQLAVTIAAMALLHVAIRGSGALPYRFPKSFYAWCGLVIFAGLVGRAGWRDASAGRRMASVGAVVCTAVLAATLINLHYDFYPTVASILGPVSADERKPARLAELQTQARRDGQVPARGTVVPVDPPAAASGFSHRPGFAYLPPAWFANPRPVLPAVLMVGGSPGMPSDWIRAGLADQTADRFAASHGGLAPVLVVADANGSGLADTECVDGPRGRAETYLTVDVRGWAIATLGVSPDPGRWAVAGLSEGGTCALTLALRHPDLFHTFADFSGDLAPTAGGEGQTVRDLFGGSDTARRDHQPLALLTGRCYQGLAGWFEVGSDDHGPLAAARTLVPAAEAAGVDTQLTVRSGQHNYAFWSAAFDHALPWLAGRLGLTPPVEEPTPLTGTGDASASMRRGTTCGRPDTGDGPAARRQ